MGAGSLITKFSKGAADAAQVGAAAGTSAIAAGQAMDAFVAELKMALLTHEAREQGLWSVATKQADSQSARMAKQSEVWGQI